MRLLRFRGVGVGRTTFHGHRSGFGVWPLLSGSAINLRGMEWVLLLLIAGVGFYVVVRAMSPTAPPKPPTQVRGQPSRIDVPGRPVAAPSKQARSSGHRPPAYTRERTVASRHDPKPWDSTSRDIPFAGPGLRGPLFHYGGTSVRSGAEHSGPYAVIDFETTGLSAKRDRIIEVAIVRVDANGRIEDEFATLINPEGRDVGPTFIHGITNAQVKHAPTFGDVASELLCRLSGTVVVAHNATFEEAFLDAELKRAGLEVARLPALCTLWLGRQTFTTPNYKLGTLARAAGVPLVDKHAALGDVRAVSALLPQMTRQLRTPVLYTCAPMSWTSRNPQPLPLVTRAVALRKGSDGWMHSLMARLPVTGIAPHNAAAEAYLDALAEVLSDGKITGEEAKELAHLAGSAGMGSEQVLELNKRFLDSLQTTALDDDVLTATEVRQLKSAAKALGLPGYFDDLQPTPAPPYPVSRERANRVDTPGGNSMNDRAERGVEALAMQRQGSSRAEIAAVLRVSQETVKSLLRDAKFYENPQSDPSRLAMAREARQARDSGVTRDAFQRDRQMTAGKSAEAWRDAAMVSDAR